MSEGWAEYLADGSLDSENLRAASDALADTALSVEQSGVSPEAVAALDGAAWDDAAAADLAGDAEVATGYAESLSEDAQAHLDRAVVERDFGDTADAAWEFQQAGLATDSANSWSADAAASYDAAAGYAESADAGVLDASADLAYDAGTDVAEY